MLPLIFLGIISLIRYSRQGFYSLFGLQFAIILMNCFVDIKIGVFTLILTAVILIFLIIHNIYDNTTNWEMSLNGMFWLFLTWSGYCILEIANPNCVLDAWNISITQYAVYPLVCAVILPIALKTKKGIEILLLIWSVFVLIAVLIAMRQKIFGFNEGEKYFLFVLGHAKQHIIGSGIRYFSCFTDAANFGVHMAMAATTFGISMFYVKNKFFKIYLFVITIGAFYGLALSGTRAAIAVPLVGLILFTILSRNLKIAFISFFSLVLVFSFFSFTNVGNNNSYIRRMRSAFHPTNDASYEVRIENRKKMKELMAYRPFGYGIGLSKSFLFHPKDPMPYPPDSWLVSVWVETGIIGFILYLLVYIALFAWASWILLFKVHNKRIRGLSAAWLCMCAGFFVAAYANDIMQYPNSIVFYTGFALCFAAPYIKDKSDPKEDAFTVKLSTKKV
jgi:hypothetical protein